MWYGNSFIFHKLAVEQPEELNSILLFFFFIVILLSLRRSKGNETSGLDRLHSIQLKGLAIVFVYMSHFWVHVSEVRPSFTLGNIAVSLFFTLSGFGLTASAQKRALPPLTFVKKRLRRIMLPYWSATVVICSLDFFLLGKTYQSSQLIATIAGINITKTTSHIDYSRWFITLLLVWYIFHYFIYKIIRTEKKRYFALFTTASVLYLCSYYLPYLDWRLTYSFPFGCLLAEIGRGNKWKLKKSAEISLIIAGIGFWVLSSSYGDWWVGWLPLLPDLVKGFGQEMGSLLLCWTIICLSGKICKQGWHSAVLTALGKDSYEIFLLHGPFLIKYNPIITGVSTPALFWQLVLLFLMIWAGSRLFRLILEQAPSP